MRAITDIRTRPSLPLTTLCAPSGLHVASTQANVQAVKKLAASTTSIVRERLGRGRNRRRNVDSMVSGRV
jgi:hypothetical protein